MKTSSSYQPKQVQITTNQVLSESYRNLQHQETVTINVNEESSNLHLTRTNLQVILLLE